MMTLSGEAMLAVEWLLVAIALILIVARINLRFSYQGQPFKPSDFCALGSFASGLTCVSLDTVQYTRGLFQEYIDYELGDWVPESDEQGTRVLKTFFVELNLYFLLIYMAKGSLVAFYYEIFGRHAGTSRTLLHFLAGFVVAAFVSTVLVTTTSCRPWGCYWSFTTICSPTCFTINDNLAWSLHFVCEIAIFVFPLVFINRLQMSLAQKISACVTFAFGFISISITLSRWFVVQAPFTPTTTLTVGYLLTVGDGLSGLIIAILPTLRPYIRMWRGEREGLASRLASRGYAKAASDRISSTNGEKSSASGPCNDAHG